MKKTLKSFFLITIIRDKLVFILLLSIKQDISLFVGVVLYLCFHKKAPVKSEMCNRPLLVIDLVIDHLFFRVIVIVIGLFYRIAIVIVIRLKKFAFEDYND